MPDMLCLRRCWAFMSDSMGLLSDAGHNLSDIFSLLVALVAFRVSKTSLQSVLHMDFGVLQ